jgi:probable rRNA maturation factor
VTIEIEIAVEAPAWMSLPDAKVTLRRAIEEAIADAGLAETELGVVLTDDAHIRALNRAWRGADEATNVLSFPVPAGPAPGPRLLGDLVLAFETVMREAAAMGKSANHHLSHLAVHGVLHLLGFDHERDEESEAMEDRERAILARLGVPDPYALGNRRRKQPA